MYRLVQLPERPVDWDALIRDYNTKTLFHESCWLDHVLSIHPEGRIDYFEIREGEDRVGYFCALRVTKLGLPIYGSPLGGTGTNFMGPLVNRAVDQKALLAAIGRLASPRRFLHIELSNPWLETELLAGVGFEVHPSVTHMVPLDCDEEEAWSRMTGTARNRVRKAEKNGLQVDASPGPEVVDAFYEQFIEVYGKQGMAPPFPVDRVRSLYQHLVPAGRLLTLAIRHEGRPVATGLFPYDEHAIYFWGAASWLADQKLCPNELLHWSVMRFAVERGIPAYNMCGGTSRFKDKFGGADVPYLHYSRSSLPGLRVLRRWYRAYHWWSLKRKGSLAVRTGD